MGSRGEDHERTGDFQFVANPSPPLPTSSAPLLDLLAGTLAVAFGLVGVNALHAVENVFRVGALDGRFAGAGFVATGTRCRVAGQLATTCFVGLECVNHGVNLAGI